MSASVPSLDNRPPPLFIVGSARSGTTLLYHTLLSSGEYAVYLGEPAVFDLLAPRFGDLRSAAARRRLRRVWPRSHLAAASGLDDPSRCAALLARCHSNGDFLRAVMATLAERQGIGRWAVWGPDNLLLMPWIKRELPDARFIHIVRDGRDIALSLSTEGWIRPFPWDRDHGLVIAALHWAWKLERGRRDRAALGDDYMEVRFESLVTQPAETLQMISAFLGHPLDYDVVRKARLGTLRARNSTFRSEGSHPVARWRSRLSPAQVALIEAAIGPTLEAFGYDRAGDAGLSLPWRLRAIYPRYFDLKHFLRTYTALGRWVDDRRLRLNRPEVAASPASASKDSQP
jgi:hypothetical protein